MLLCMVIFYLESRRIWCSNWRDCVSLTSEVVLMCRILSVIFEILESFSLIRTYELVLGIVIVFLLLPRAKRRGPAAACLGVGDRSGLELSSSLPSSSTLVASVSSLQPSRLLYSLTASRAQSTWAPRADLIELLKEER